MRLSMKSSARNGIQSEEAGSGLGMMACVNTEKILTELLVLNEFRNTSTDYCNIKYADRMTVELFGATIYNDYPHCL